MASGTYLRHRRKSGPRSLRQSSMQKIWKEQMSAVEQLQQPNDLARRSPLASPPAPPSTRRISLTVLRIVLALYKEKLYGIWPMLSGEELLQQLQNDPRDVETYALTTALCGATLSHLNQTVTHDSLPEPMTALSFAQEARRVRTTFDYMEPVSLNTVLRRTSCTSTTASSPRARRRPPSTSARPSPLRSCWACTRRKRTSSIR